MFKRKAYDRLQEWKERSQGRTAVLIEGARRVGKTTLVKCFAQNEYKDYLYIDFSAASKATLDIFLDHREDVDLFLRMLQLQYGKALEPRESLVIFDEVQRFPIAREYIKHLVEDGRFDYIETGSLVSIKKNVDSIVIPSEEERIPLEPLDFEEYLWATGQDLYAEEIRKACESRTALPDGVHATCMRLFDEYMLVGGMPQSVDSFVAENDFRGCDRVKRQIIALYREDIAKFGGSDARRARAVYDDIPGQLSAANKRFKFDSLEKGSRFETYESALIWLEDARLINRCYLCSDPSVGYRLHEDASSLKCYMADTGLLVSLAFDDGPDLMDVHRDIQFGRISINKGMLIENIVAQQLKSLGHSLFYYSWQEPSKTEGSRPRTREIDFLVSSGFEDAAGKPRVTPVEVKSSKSYSTISLDDFGRRFERRVGEEIVLHPKQLRAEGHRIYLPLYMTIFI